MTNTNESQSAGASNAHDRKVQRFQKVAPARVNKVAKAMQVLSRCGNRVVYEYTDEEVNKMFTFLDDCLKDMKSRFRQKEKESCPTFKF